MKNLTLPVAVVGLVALLLAFVWNEAQATPAAARQLVIESIAAAVVAIACGAYVFRKGGQWRFLAIVIIGPAVFTLADAGVRLIGLSRH